MGTHITHDGWARYIFLDKDDESVWIHETHRNGFGYFRNELISTNNIEQFFGQLKAFIKKIYYIIPKKALFTIL